MRPQDASESCKKLALSLVSSKLLPPSGISVNNSSINFFSILDTFFPTFQLSCQMIFWQIYQLVSYCYRQVEFIPFQHLYPSPDSLLGLPENLSGFVGSFSQPPMKYLIEKMICTITEYLMHDSYRNLHSEPKSLTLGVPLVTQQQFWRIC